VSYDAVTVDREIAVRFEVSVRVNEILEQSPRQVVLKDSGLREFLLMGIAILVFVGSILYIVRNASFAGILIGLLGIGLAWLLAFAKQSLTLDDDGFAHLFFPGSRRYRWDEVREFRARSMCYGVVLSFNQMRDAENWVAKINRVTMGGDTCIFLGNWLTATELAALMNAWRARALPADL
jgi:hypothetical protein